MKKKMYVYKNAAVEKTKNNKIYNPHSRLCFTYRKARYALDIKNLRLFNKGTQLQVSDLI